MRSLWNHTAQALSVLRDNLDILAKRSVEEISLIGHGRSEDAFALRSGSEPLEQAGQLHIERFRVGPIVAFVDDQDITHKRLLVTV